MSYCRFGEDSDVYVFENIVGRLECCGCDLREHGSFLTKSRTAMLAHLDEHRATGHLVPDYALERLRAELDELGDEIVMTP